MKWEYKTESKFGLALFGSIPNGTNPASARMPEESRIDYLNRMGADGWELIAEKNCGSIYDGSHVDFTFKRLVHEPPLTFTGDPAEFKKQWEKSLEGGAGRMVQIESSDPTSHPDFRAVIAPRPPCAAKDL